MTLNESSVLVSYTFNALIDGAELPFSLEKVQSKMYLKIDLSLKTL